jgi:hypothetical protein
MQRGQRRLQHTSPVIDALLHGDYPETVKRAVALAVKGGRWGKQACLKCGKRGRFLSAYIPPALLAPVPAEDARMKLYWLREAHRGVLSDEEVAALLGGDSTPRCSP